MKNRIISMAVIASLFIPPISSARFISVDPKASNYPGVTPYTYVRNNPIKRLDPDGLTDILFQVNRTTETKKSTIGNFRLSNSRDKKTLTGATLELPWDNNKVDKSRIPLGSYDAFLRTSKGTFNYPRITLKNVPGRTGIVVHRGNTPDEIKGCILCGTTAGKDRVNDSEKAVTGIGEYIQAADKKRGEKTNITVEVNDPPQKETTNDDNKPYED